MKKPLPKHQPTPAKSKPARELGELDLESVTGGATSVEYALMLTAIR